MYCIRCHKTSFIGEMVRDNIVEDWLIVFLYGDNVALNKVRIPTEQIGTNSILYRKDSLRHSIGLCPRCMLSEQQLMNLVK